MNGFTLHLLAADRSERIDGVTSFVGEDKRGSFGLLARHERFMTVLGFGLARLRGADGRWEYLGIPGGLLYFRANECHISTRRYLRGSDVARIAQALGRDMLAEERALDETRRKLHRLEAEMLRRLVELGRE